MFGQRAGRPHTRKCHDRAAGHVGREESVTVAPRADVRDGAEVCRPQDRRLGLPSERGVLRDQILQLAVAGPQEVDASAVVTHRQLADAVARRTAEHARRPRQPAAGRPRGVDARASARGRLERDPGSVVVAA